jgi:putative DNA primase/helicase
LDWCGGTIEALNELVETRAKVFTKGSGSDFAPTEDRGGVPKAKPTIERPVIMVWAGELPRMVDEAEQALLDARVPVFSRGGILVSPVSEEVPTADDRTTTIVRLREIRLDNMIDNLARCADFRRASKEGSVAVDPPARVASILLARDGSWRFPKIAGVITTPTLRPNGSLLDKPGYDEATRLYLKPDRGLRLRIKDEPSVDDARIALQLLKDLLVGFPFANPVDRTVAISAIVTAVLRSAMSVAPLHLIRAHCAGTGKSHLVDVAASIATGRRCPVITAGKTLEETEKRLGSQLLAATPIVSIDNAAADLGGDMLCQVTERPLIPVRVLGKSETPELECRSMVFATGNNVSVFGDMTRRAVICNLDANVERPELRSFQFDPIHRVVADRGTFVAAAITIALAYRAAKMPEVCGPIGSYGEWSRLVRAPLIWLGDQDPAKSMELARDEDPELAAIHQLFTLWPECLSLTSPYTTKQIIEAATKHSEFRELLMLQAGDAREIVSKRLGRWLTKITGRVVNGHRLTMAEGKGRGNRYALLPPDTQLKV